MKPQILICDDSKLARKQTANSVLGFTDADIFFAKNAAQAYAVLQNQAIELLLLDLHLPQISGFEILKTIKPIYPNLKTIVISADSQQKTKQIIIELGAELLLEKPVPNEELFFALNHLKINTVPQLLANPEQQTVKPDLIEACQELANIAMGNSASLFGLLYDRFVEMQSPKVNFLPLNKLTLELSKLPKDNFSAVCQSFIGSGLSGEAVLLFNVDGFKDMTSIMGIEDSDHPEAEILVDLSNMLVGAFLTGFSELLDCKVNQNNPVIVGHHLCVEEVFDEHSSLQEHFVIEMNYVIPHTKVDCSLIVVLSEQSIPNLESVIKGLKIWS